MKSCAKNKDFQAHITCLHLATARCYELWIDSCLQNMSKVRLAPTIASVLYLLTCLRDLYPRCLSFGLCSFPTGFNTPDSYGCRAITRIFLATVYRSPWRLSTEGLCMEVCIGTAKFTPSSDRNYLLGLGRILTDWNAETFFMAENSMSDITLILSQFHFHHGASHDSERLILVR